jgi:hypothetical protein
MPRRTDTPRTRREGGLASRTPAPRASRPRRSFRILACCVALACGVALTQASLTTFDGSAYGYALGYPSGWQLEQEEAGGYLLVQPPQGSPEAGRVAIELLADPDVTGSLEEGVEDVLSELRANLLPDLSILSRTPTTVSGVPAVVVQLTGTVEGTQPVTYRLLLVLDGRTGYVLFLEALRDDFASYVPLFDAVQASFTLTRTQAAPATPSAPLAPLGPSTRTAPVVPDAPAPPPPTAAPATPATPAAPSPPAEVVASTAGTADIGAVAPDGRARGRLDGVADDLAFHGYYVDVPAGSSRLTIVLDADLDLDLAVKHGAATESFADRDQGGDWDYRDIGTQNPTRLVIDRPAAGRWFVDVLNALGAGRNGTYVLAFATEGGGAPPASPGGAAPPQPPEVVADATGTAFIGALPLDGRARGRLDGGAGRATYHTYVVEVPAGTARVTIVLDADDDLDLVVKGGSEIRSYADLDQGGDWDYRDLDTRNPTTIVLEAPAPGPWYVDVVNALGADRSASYLLTAGAGGGF